MALRPYAAAKRTLSAADKLLEVNWGLVLLIVLIGCAGIAMLYSVAGGHLQPWALKQMSYFTLGLIVLLAAAMIDIRVWMSWPIPLMALRCCCWWRWMWWAMSGLGAQRWITHRAAGTAAVGADEDQPGAGAGALSARQERGGHLQAAAAGASGWP